MTGVEAAKLGEGTVALLCEDRAEEWHFDEGTHAERISCFEEQRAEHQRRVHLAKEAVARAKREAFEHASKVCGDVEECDRARGSELSKVREELVDLYEQMELAREDCERRLLEMDREAQAHREDRSQLETDLSVERRKLESVRHRIAEYEEDERLQIRAKDEALASIRSQTQQDVVAHQRSAEERVRDIEARARDWIQDIELEIVAELKLTRETVQTEVRLRGDFVGKARSASTAVDATVIAELDRTKDKVVDLQKQSLAEISVIQARDFAKEHLLKDHVDAASHACGCADEEHHRAAAWEYDIEHLRLEALRPAGTRLPFIGEPNRLRSTRHGNLNLA